MLAAPFMTRNGLRMMSQENLEILANWEVVAVDEKRLGVQGFRSFAEDRVKTWFKPLTDGAWAMCVLNGTNAARQVTFDWKSEPESDTFARRSTHFASSIDHVRDQWAKKILGTPGEPLAAKMPVRDVLMLRLN
jgi:alpha-galactosidase